MIPTTFRDELHQVEYNELIEQMYLSENELENPTPLLRRQVAFAYLIALYQNEYEHYEGCKFYMEAYDEISLDGPVYLLEDEMELESYPHERMLKVAKALMQGEELPRALIDQSLQAYIDEAIEVLKIV